MKTIEEIISYCNSGKSSSTLRRVLPRMIQTFNDEHEGVMLHYGYHEDNQQTWSCGWSEEDYYPWDFDEDDHKIEKMFEMTWLIGKKKPTRSFCKAQTYTAECAIFVFKIIDKEIDS